MNADSAMGAAVRVLHVIPSIGPARGGPSVVIRTMARCQSERGLEVHVATTDDNGPGRLANPGNVPVTEESVTYWIFPRQTPFYLFSFPLTRWLRKHTTDYDVVHIHALFSYASVAAALCARLAGVPYIVRPLGTLNQWGMRHRRRWLKKLSFRLIESRILRASAGVHYTSEQEALEAKQWGVTHNPFVIPNPVDLLGPRKAHIDFRSAHSHLMGKTLVLFLSRLDPIKGLDLLLPAFGRVRSRYPEAVLVVAGDGDPNFVTGLKQQASSLGLDSGIVWTGFLRGEEKNAALADADLYVLPSYSENFGVAVVEAMGAGIPVIVSDQVGIHREIAHAEAGLVVKCGVAPLAQALKQGVADAQWRARAGENARKLAQQFAPDVIACQLVELYRRILIKNDQPAAA